MNVAVDYMYRDGGNNKSEVATVVFGRDATVEKRMGNLEDRLKAALDDGRCFMAHQVGVPEVFLWDGTYELTPDVDHCWHEFLEMRMVDEPVTDRARRSLTAFVKDVEAAAKRGWDVFEPGTEEAKRRHHPARQAQLRGKGRSR